MEQKACRLQRYAFCYRGMAQLLKKIKARRGMLLLLLILLLAAYLTCWKIWKTGDGNTYYTAAVTGMLKSWRNFFFVSFDPGGFISVDKPPLGLWLQCLFGLVFGVHGWSLILPEALCAIGSVAVLYGIVKKTRSEAAALLAALFLAATPVFAAVSRTNNLDAPLVFVCLLALWAAMKAAEKGSLKYIVLTMVLLGLGFNIKMLQAYMFLPAVYIVYFFTAETTWSKRIIHLVIATAVLLAVSLSWCLIVDLTPAQDRPFVGGSVHNSALELAVGYNGILRALPVDSDALQGISGAVGFVPNEGGKPGFLRLFNREMAGQVSWLLPLAVFGITALLMNVFGKDAAARKRDLRQLLLWGGAFVPMAACFSVTTHIHRYYLIMLAPCLAALAAIAVTEFYGRFRTGNGIWQSILLPLALAVTAAAQVCILRAHYPAFSNILAPVIIAAAGAAIILLFVVKLLKKENKVIALAAAAVAVTGLLAAPAYWAYAPMYYGTNAVSPFAGPPAVSAPTNNGREQGVFTMVVWRVPKEVMGYMLTSDNGARYLVALPNVACSVPVILEYGVSVMTLGGFLGTDNAITLGDFKKLVADGDLQYFLTMPADKSEISGWVMTHGRLVDPSEYSKTPKTEFLRLYDLSGLKGK
jgi:4-amino-4-deoxy-L-arabinose transferase-like glycosyltransferase